jgi:hypothetical protein
MVVYLQYNVYIVWRVKCLLPNAGNRAPIVSANFVYLRAFYTGDS